MGEILERISTFDPLWISITIFLIAFLENIFPPAPSDAIVLLGGALAGMEQVSFIAPLAAGTAGSTLGFMTMYGVGRWFGQRILERGKISWVNLDALHKFEKWFARYGFWLILGNRFLPGTRAVISFFAGVSRTDFRTTSILSSLGSLAWYGILVYGGYTLGAQWQKAGEYLKTYGVAVTIIVSLALTSVILRKILRSHD